MRAHERTGWPYDAVVARATYQTSARKAQPQDWADMMELVQKLAAQVTAQGAVIRCLLAASPDLEQIALHHLDAMDAVADVVDVAGIDRERAAHQDLQAAMLHELNKRGARAAGKF